MMLVLMSAGALWLRGAAAALGVVWLWFRCVKNGKRIESVVVDVYVVENCGDVVIVLTYKQMILMGIKSTVPAVFKKARVRGRAGVGTRACGCASARVCECARASACEERERARESARERERERERVRERARASKSERQREMN